MSVQMFFYYVRKIWFKDESVRVTEITLVILLGEKMKTLSSIAGNMLLNLNIERKRNYMTTLLIRAFMLSVTLMAKHMSSLILTQIYVGA